MCGIAGKIAAQKKSEVISSSTSLQVFEDLGHRGPDSQGQYSDDRVWLGHVRLSILDLTNAGHQPMSSSDGRYVISYNGEVYNFQDLAQELNFANLKSHSDTEVVLKAFEKIGIDSFLKLNGMFAYAIYDRVSEKCWIVRDRLGIKPVYYFADENGFSFSSEVKALTSLLDSNLTCNLDAVHEWLYYGTTFGKPTLLKGIQKLLPGHFIEVDLETFKVSTVCYWSPKHPASLPKFKGTLDEVTQRTQLLLEKAVQRQLISDVPVGVFLSGGIDSSAITAFASRHYQGKLATYSVGFDFDKGVNELPKAKSIAQLFGTNHHELHVSGLQISDIIEKMIDHHGMPFSDAANIPLYLLCSKLDKKSKVILQGDGGDELFGGYSRYFTLHHYKKLKLAAKFGRPVLRCMSDNPRKFRLQRYLNALSPTDQSHVMALLLTEEDGNESPTQIFDPEFQAQIKQSDPFSRFSECRDLFKDEGLVNQMLLVDSMMILPDIFLEKVDRSTMAASIEVRVPFLDHELVDFCMQLTGPQKVHSGQKKWLLKRALRGVIPDTVLDGKKTGFGVPYGFWLRTSLKPLFFDQLRTFQTRYPRVLDEKRIQQLFAEHETQKRDRSFLLWKLLNFMIWADRFSVQFSIEKPTANFVPTELQTSI